MKNKTMKIKKIILIIGLGLLLSCNRETKKVNINIKTDSSVSSKKLRISDSLLIGCPKIADAEFIKNIYNEFEYFDKYEKILQNINTKYMFFQKKEVIKEEKINNIVLKLIKKSLKKDDIKIELHIYKNNIKTDSILFYKYEYDKNVPDNMQRLECLSYIDYELYLWHLETFTNHSEDALGFDTWEKYKIDTNTGKIILVEKLKPYK
ncbi:hypothetical protein GKZ90_0019375 [Flavobacterium sp. MC2016-06]|uniref:hypothetical protein n=1 Tax=Flavobacterium sp. MC2016-06 TaxID=2676308 RepID=UPI0012BA9B1C|nr:hypothetical protein [Flavobacterium sp. MC2016-06]MBU3861960.1 hypothetical protein [Flavobacterium sp. MC2016-06]